MKQGIRRLSAFMAVSPVAVLALWAAAGGGSVPSDMAGYLPITASSTDIEFGSSVRVSGASGSLVPGSKVKVIQFGSEGARRQLSVATVGPRRRWSTLARPLSAGRIAAVPAAAAGPAGSGASPSLAIKVRHRLVTAERHVTRRAAHAFISGSIGPAVRTKIRAERSSGGRWVPLGSGYSDRNGRFKVPVGRSVNGLVRLRTESTQGLEGSNPKRLRVERLRPALASWYGLYGGPLACGGRLGRDQMGVAHKTLKCGTRVTISYRGRTVVVPVIDRGPYVGAREWDLTGAVARKLGFDGVGTVWVSP